MNVLLWNLHRGRELRGSTDRLISVLQRFPRIDMLCLLEADADLPAATSIFDLDQVASETGLRSVMPPHLRTWPGVSDGIMGMVVLAREAVALRDLSVLSLPQAREPRAMLKASVSSDKLAFDLALTQLCRRDLIRLPGAGACVAIRTASRSRLELRTLFTQWDSSPSNFRTCC